MLSLMKEMLSHIYDYDVFRNKEAIIYKFHQLMKIFMSYLKNNKKKSMLILFIFNKKILIRIFLLRL